MSPNLRGILLMVAAMGAFAVEDTFIKLASDELPVGQILLLLGLSGIAIFGTLARRQGLAVIDRRALGGAMIMRNLGEMLGTFGFITAIALAPLTIATAIFQVTPLAVTLAAAVLLREQVGWRRWTAVIVGFAGVLVVIRPWGEAFEPAALFALLGVLGLSARDIATRRIGRDVHTLQIVTWAMVAVALIGAILLGISGGAQWPDAGEWGFLVGAGLVGAVAYWLLTEAMRSGEVSVVTPFRYSRLLFATLLGLLVFGEQLDLATVIGGAMVVGSGLYGFARERARQRAAALASAGPSV
jgi:drug/metabolite transporter (DMT)-like permease